MRLSCESQRVDFCHGARRTARRDRDTRLALRLVGTDAVGRIDPPPARVRRAAVAASQSWIGPLSGISRAPNPIGIGGADD